MAAWETSEDTENLKVISENSGETLKVRGSFKCCAFPKMAARRNPTPCRCSTAGATWGFGMSARSAGIEEITQEHMDNTDTCPMSTRYDAKAAVDKAWDTLSNLSPWDFKSEVVHSICEEGRKIPGMWNVSKHTRRESCFGVSTPFTTMDTEQCSLSTEHPFQVAAARILDTIFLFDK